MKSRRALYDAAAYLFLSEDNSGNMYNDKK
jgi:hypothetical protein